MRRLYFYIPIMALLFLGTYLLFKDLFISVCIGSGFSFVFISYELVVEVKKVQPVKSKISIYFFAVVCIAGMAAPNIYMYDRTKWQHDTLLTVGSVIDEGIISWKLSAEGFKIFKNYYSNDNKGKKNFISVFNSLYSIKPAKPAIIDTIFEDNTKKKFSCILYLQSLTEDEIVISARGSYWRGVDKDFKNIDGEKGRVQAKVTINSKGVKYEPEN